MPELDLAFSNAPSHVAATAFYQSSVPANSSTIPATEAIIQPDVPKLPPNGFIPLVWADSCSEFSSYAIFTGSSKKGPIAN